MPTLNWIGKDKVVNHHQDVPYRVLEHKYGFTAENGEQELETKSGNKIIHGDNLEALKALLPEYEGKIKGIYIDPPYNTGEEKWVYNDNVNHPKIKKWIGELVGDDEQDFTRHDKWLCMMYPRLKLLQKLLDDDGVIFISIDDNENSKLKMLCDDIFGQKSFVTCLVWEKKKKGTHLDKKRISIKEYIYVYCKNRHSFNGLIGEINSKKETYPCINPGNSRAVRTIPAGTKSTYREKNYILNSGQKISAGNMYLELFDDLILDNGRLKKDVRVEAEWRYSQENLTLFASNDELYFTRDLYLRREVNDTRFKKLKDLLHRVEYDTINELKDKLIKELLKPNQNQSKIEELQLELQSYENLHHLENDDLKNLNNTGWGSNEDGDEELRNIFGKKVFDFPKPTRLITKLLASTLFENGVFLDSFAGTGTTGHAILNLNAIQKTTKNFILIEMEDYANTITAERLKRIIKGYSKGKKTYKGIGGSYDYYELGSPIFKNDKNLNEDVGEAKIREYIYYTETKQHLEREQSPEHKYLLDTYNETGYYFYYEKDRLTTLSLDTLNIVTEKAEQYLIYADTCHLDKEYMLAKNIIFKKIPRDIKRF